ncbi:MAG: cysteine--tRNA ligase [Labilithrix sp.]|nr:cysteine--tRNA ligase [Labilithrix sp.]MCW5811093.1 cysteine--tRNA ligase [Labilithrix sp.]
MPVRLYNTLTQKVEDFVPLVPGKVKLYVCGITVYDLAHAGHGRTYTTFDVLVRFLRARGFEVEHCQNVTDVDDKIVNRAKERGEDPLALSKRMGDLADEHLRAIGCLKPTYMPRVSTTIGGIAKITQTLIDKSHAYVAETPVGKDVYYAVRSYDGYGKLSRRNVDDLRSGASERLAENADEVKKDPLDFALWKGQAKDAFGFDSPWGHGRPGWHIECSAMANEVLGEQIDIHGGGMDLIFPHHENEVAQSEAANGKPFARFWMHGGFLEIDKEKMAKSLGNFVTIKDVLEKNDPEAYRYFILGTHYRGPLSFDVDKAGDRVTFPGLDEAERRMDYLYSTRDALVALAGDAEPEASNVLQGQQAIVAEAKEKVLEALDRDLNTPVALSVLADLGKAMNEIAMQAPKMKKDPAKHEAVRKLAAAAVKSLQAATAPLGLMQASSADYWARTKERRLRIRGLDAAKIDAKIGERAEARKAKDFARADAIRKELADLGVEVFDAGDGSSWKVTI